MVFREVAAGKVSDAVRLVVQAVVFLGGVAQVRGVMIIELVVETAVVASLKEGRRDDLRRVRANGLSENEFVVGSGVFGKAGVLALTLEGKEAEQFVLDDRSTDRAAEDLAAVG